MTRLGRDPENIILCIKDTGGNWMSFEIGWEAEADELTTIFRLILSWLGYARETIHELISDPDIEE
jgi:hypothetical protein